MTFTYDVSAPNDITRVRFEIQDTDAANPRFQDEDIQFILNENSGSIPLAVLAILRAEQTRLATLPNYHADWLKVERQYQRDALAKLIDRKEGEVAVSSDSSSGSGIVFLSRPGD